MKLLRKKPTQRPANYSERSRLSYYNSKYGNQILPFLERLKEEPNKKVTISAAKLCRHVNTVFQMVHQGWLWLETEHPNREVWEQMRKEYSVCREGNNVVIRKKGSFALNIVQSGVVEDEVEPQTSLGDWKNKIEEYVVEAPDKSAPLEIRGIYLNDRDIEWLSVYLGGVDERAAVRSVEKTKIKIVKNRELALKMKEENES